MKRRFVHFRYAACVLAGVGLVQIAATTTAAPREASITAYGHWMERDDKLDFEIHPGANPDQLVLVIPSNVEHSGCWRAGSRNLEFLLKKANDVRYEAHDPGRPKVTLSFKSASKASLNVWGHDANGICMNGYALVRR